MNQFIKILGAYGGKGINMDLTSIQVSKHILIDAGNIICSLNKDIKYINHIFVSHSHLDHINDIAYLIDSTLATRKESLKIYGRKKTLDNLSNHIFNWEIWPNFREINLIDNPNIPSLEMIEIELNEIIEIDNYRIKVIENNHTPPSNGFVIEKNSSAILFTSDTYCCKKIWDEVNKNKKITTVIVDVSFPSRLKQLSNDSKHLTADLLKDELKQIERDNITVHINHIKPAYKDEVINEILKNNLLLNGGKVLNGQDIINF